VESESSEYTLNKLKGVLNAGDEVWEDLKTGAEKTGDDTRCLCKVVVPKILAIRGGNNSRSITQTNQPFEGKNACRF